MQYPDPDPPRRLQQRQPENYATHAKIMGYPRQLGEPPAAGVPVLVHHAGLCFPFKEPKDPRNDIKGHFIYSVWALRFSHWNQKSGPEVVLVQNQL